MKVIKTKILFVSVIGLILASCASSDFNSKSSGARIPSSDAHMKRSLLGKVKFSEGKHTAGAESVTGEPAAFYTLQVDCDRDGRLSREEQGLIVRFEQQDVSKQERSNYSELKRLAEQRERRASATPYVAVVFEELSGPPCAPGVSPVGRVLIGKNPTFLAR